MAKVRIDLDDDDLVTSPGSTKKVADMAAGLPSAHKAKLQSLKEADRVQFSFTQVPKPIKDMFDEEAKRRNMGKKEFLFHCLRAGGLDIPDFSDIDGRKR